MTNEPNKPLDEIIEKLAQEIIAKSEALNAEINAVMALESVYTESKCAAVNSEGHPTFNNPNGWTQAEMKNFYKKYLAPRSMAANIKWMGLAHHMKKGSYADEVARMDSKE